MSKLLNELDYLFERHYTGIDQQIEFLEESIEDLNRILEDLKLEKEHKNESEND